MLVNSQGARLDFSDAQLKLIRRSVARLCTSAEFDEFMAVAAQCGLDPLRRQIAPLIVSADDPDRRRLIPWTTIDGLRVIAARHKDYRPMDEAPIIEYDQGRIDEAKNPLGIVRAEVRAWKASDGVWHAVVGEAWWDEFAPMRRPGAAMRSETAGVGGSAADTTANVSECHLEPSWRRMGRVMIAKCAEAQALRRGWPDLLSGLYGEEELNAVRLAEHTASEVLQRAHEDEDRKRKATRTLWFIAKPGASFQPLSVGDVENFVSAAYLAAQEDADIRRFDDDNRASLTTYWDWMPREAFRLKAMSEALQTALGGRNDQGRRQPQEGKVVADGHGVDAHRDRDPARCDGSSNPGISAMRSNAVRAPSENNDKKIARDRFCRRRPSSQLKRSILDAQEGRCLACGAILVDVEFDHVIPLGLGGDNTPENWAAVCRPCHKVKTRADLKRIAKAKRQRRYHETGRSRAKRMFSPIAGIRGRGFDKTKRRHINGLVSSKCSCATCQSKSEK